MRHHITNNLRQGKKVSRSGFTLVEVLVALAIFMLLLAIILVPLNMGFTMLHLGKANSDVQSATQRVIDRMRGDLTKAIYVYPNDIVPTVTGVPTSPKLPYGDPALIAAGATSVPVNPYFDGDPCNAATSRVSNLSRIDMLLPDTNNGNILTPVLPTYYIVTYYARRRDVTPPTTPYQPIDNPIVLYRAQIPFRGDPPPANPDYLISDGGAALTPASSSAQYPATDSLNANIYNSRYTNLTACGVGSPASISAKWLMQSTDGEPDLEPLTNENFNSNPAAPFTLYGSHVSLLPTNVGLVTGVDYRGYENNTLVTTYTAPKSTFTCTDTNKDGIIDQVTLSVLLQEVDQSGAEPSGQRITLPQVVNLPNVRSIANVQ
jgi:prepilin-type N-terminal cleavage/methylation domain-containing protein